MNTNIYTIRSHERLHTLTWLLDCTCISNTFCFYRATNNSLHTVFYYFNFILLIDRFFMSLKKQPPTILSFSSQHRLATFFQVLAAINKRIHKTKITKQKYPIKSTKYALISHDSFLCSK